MFPSATLTSSLERSEPPPQSCWLLPTSRCDQLTQMNLLITDFGGFEDIVHEDVWADLEDVLSALPLSLKQSDQAGRIGTYIFDPVGTNETIKSALRAKGWGTNIPIPADLQGLGTDVDYGRNGLIAEGQFSNYPFFFNNVFRTHVFHKSGIEFPHVGTVRGAVVITKARLFPASNSTLYYEQALRQMNFLMGIRAVQMPVRLIGLTADQNAPMDAVFTRYHAPRYSRTVVDRIIIRCVLRPGRDLNSRCRIEAVREEPEIEPGG